METTKIRVAVNKDKYNRYKQLVKVKKNEDITFYNIDLFEKAMSEEIEQLKQLPDKRRTV